MRLLTGALLGLVLLGVLAIGAALVLVASPPPPRGESRDVYGFAGLVGSARPDLPEPRTFAARDGTELAYRFYDAEAERLLVFVHGSSYHGASYHGLASRLAGGGVAKVALPNLRGHHLSGRRRGDVDYIGQLEDDLADLIAALRAAGHAGPVVLGGHSSGGGLAIRFAGGAHAEAVSGFLLLAPVIPGSPAIRDGTGGGWAQLHGRRLVGLLLLNALGIHGLDGLPVIEFDKPRRFWDGSETLAYSHRLNASYHPRRDPAADIRALRRRPWLLLVGELDEAVDPAELRALFPEPGAHERLAVLPGVSHFGVFLEPEPLERLAAWLARR